MKFPPSPVLYVLPLLGLAMSPAAAQQVSAFTLEPAAGPPEGRYVAALEATLPGAIDHIVEDSPDLLTWNRVSPLLLPAGSELAWGHTQAAPLFGTPLHIDGSQDWQTRRFYRVRPLPAAGDIPAGPPAGAAGRLTRPVPEGPYILTTPAGWIIQSNATTLTISSPAGPKYELWGAGGHENLRGKHLKDMLGTRRSILLPGDTMVTVTLTTQAMTYPAGTIHLISIYDGDQSHRLNIQTGAVEMSATATRAGEAAEADGETGRIWDTGAGLFFENLYDKPNPGNGAPLPQTAVPLGRTFGPANPNQVNDYYDDPRVGHT